MPDTTMNNDLGVSFICSCPRPSVNGVALNYACMEPRLQTSPANCTTRAVSSFLKCFESPGSMLTFRSI